MATDSLNMISQSPFKVAHITRDLGCNPILFDCIQAGTPQSLELDIWYFNRHLPKKRDKSTKHTFRYYAAPSHAGYIYIQELEHDDLLANKRFEYASPAPNAIRMHIRCLGRFIGGARRLEIGPTAIDAKYVYPIFFKVPPSWENKFNDWYESEHVPMLLECKYWLMCRRFKIDEIISCPWSHMALHYLSDLSALESPERYAARTTPWRKEFEQQPWFKFTYRLGMLLA